MSEQTISFSQNYHRPHLGMNRYNNHSENMSNDDESTPPPLIHNSITTMTVDNDHQQEEQEQLEKQRRYQSLHHHHRPHYATSSSSSPSITEHDHNNTQNQTNATTTTIATEGTTPSTTIVVANESAQQKKKNNVTTTVTTVSPDEVQIDVVPGAPTGAANSTIQPASFWSMFYSPISYLFGGNNTPAITQDASAQQSSAEEETRKQKQERLIRDGNQKGGSDSAVVIKRRKGNSYTHWISDIMQRFGTDASKTVTDAFKEPLELLARSPVLRTGEVLVVHSVDFDSLRLDRLFKYMGLFIFFLQFSKMFLHRLFLRRSGLRAITSHPSSHDQLMHKPVVAAITAEPSTSSRQPVAQQTEAKRSWRRRK